MPAERRLRSNFSVCAPDPAPALQFLVRRFFSRTRFSISVAWTPVFLMPSADLVPHIGFLYLRELGANLFWFSV
jgi:hypothetical protein